MPDNSAHIIKPDILAELDYFFPDGDDLVSAVVNGTSKLVANVYTKPASTVQNAVTLFPNKVEIIDIGFVAVVKAYLIFCAIIF